VEEFLDHVLASDIFLGYLQPAIAHVDYIVPAPA